MSVFYVVHGYKAQYCSHVTDVDSYIYRCTHKEQADTVSKHLDLQDH